MSTQAYYKDRLGFDPAEALNDGGPFDKTQHGYEENLCKFKDERDAIQKKTFTKWVNKHLKKASRHVGDLFEDLRDGHNLISLLEVLSGEHLPRERGRLRFHMLQNVQIALDFLRYRKIKLVNIRAEDIVDGNPKLTLGLIWTIILHFQISDIVVGQEPNVSARDALLRWARRTTAKYPGVQVTDFTSSWRDGLAFNAIIHRNRPDLIDWRSIRSRVARDRLENAFHVAEREYGVTRLLDPEDVDTPEPDEKSLITYISSLYDVFPEPPPIHPLYDPESQRRRAEYRDIASSLHVWMREKLSIMLDRTFPNTLIEMKKLAAESSRFRTDEVPPRQKDKQRLTHIFRELERYFEAVGEIDMEPELHIDVLDKNWNRLMMAHQERDHAILEEIKRLERLQRLAEKVHREMKQVDSRLEELEQRIEDEARRLDRLHPLDAKHNVDLLEQDIRLTEDSINSLFGDVQSLRDGRYPQASDLHKRVQKLHQRWVALRSLLHSKLITPLASLSFPVEERTVTRQTRTVLETRLVETNIHFRQLQECTEWCRNKLKQLQDAEYGSDLPSVQNELNIHQREHKTIEQFHIRVEHCVSAKNNFHGEELQLYTQYLSQLQKAYAELLVTSNKRLSDLETLQDFLQSATNELIWLNEKEEVEVSRDWSDKNLNIPAVEQYYESLMSDLEKREIQFSAVQDRGESLVLQHHPAAKCIEAYMAAMQTQWAWLLQLTLCLETHLKHASIYHQFFREVHEAEEWITKRDEIMNTLYSQSDFTLDEGERLLRGMQELREELNHYGDVVQGLSEKSKDIVPLKHRRQPVSRPVQVLAICAYKQVNIVIEKGEQCILHDNSGRVKWRVSNSSGVESSVPGACFLVPPPDKEALDAIERLKRQFDRSIALWQKKQLRMRQNMIFATIKVVKSWDLAQFLAMGQEQRNAIRKALNEDADKLLQEGDPADPQLRRLRREMEEVNRLFDEFEKRARAEEESKNATRNFNDKITSLQASLDEAERTLAARTAASLPRDLDSLEHLVIEHKEFETRLQALGPEVEDVQAIFRSVARKTPAMQTKLDKCLNKWNQLWSSSHLYIERLKCVEIVLTGLEEATTVVSEFELKLASYEELPSDVEALQVVHEDLLNLQNSVSQQQMVIDQLTEDVHNARRLVEKSRPTHRGPHSDLERLEADVGRLTTRWENVCEQLVDRLRSCEAAYGLLQAYTNSYQTEVSWVDESYGKLNNLAAIGVNAKEQLEPTKALYNSVLEKTQTIEQVNVVGGRFIREAKIYDLRLQRYCGWLVEEVHPSLDATLRTRHIDGGGGADTVAKQLDILNHRFQALLAVLYDRLRQIAALSPNDPALQLLVTQMEPRQMRTFRTEFNIFESSTTDTTESRTYNSSVHYATQSEYFHRVSTSAPHDINHTKAFADDPQNSAASLVTVTTSSGPPTKKRSKPDSDTHDAAAFTKGGTSIYSNAVVSTNGEAGSGQSPSKIRKDSPTKWSGSSMQFSEIRSLKRIHKVEEGIGTDNIIESLGIIHPSTGEVLTVGDAISLRILDVRTGRIVTSPDGRSPTVSIEEAAARGLVDPALAERLLGPCGIVEEDGQSGRQLSLLEAIQRELFDAERGFVTSAEGRVKQAVEEKYKHCDETLSKLLAWIGEVEDKLATQDVVQEDAGDLRNQINIMKQVKDDLDAHSRPVASCLDQVRQVVASGGDVLSSDEVSTLEKNGRSLKTRYERAVDRTDKLLRRLTAACDELSKFRNELVAFSTWLHKARQILEDKERSLSNLNKLTSNADSTKEFVSDVIAHQADLRFITMAAQKFVDESKEYLTSLNEFRTSLPQRLPHIEPSQDSAVRNEVSAVTAQYRDLLSRANGLSDRLSGVGGRQREYRDALDKARTWLREAEPRATKVLAEPIGAEPKTVEEQLNKAKALNNEFVAQGRLIDAAKQSVVALLRSLEGQQTPAEKAALETPVVELEEKYNQLSDALADKCRALDTALVQSQGVQDALDSLMQWLNVTENQLKSLMRPASLQKERLEEQLREHRLLQSDVDNHRPSVESVAQSAQALVATASNARLAKKIETKLRDVTTRFDKLLERTVKRGELLEEVHSALTVFSNATVQFELWYCELLDAIESRDILKLEIAEYGVKIDEIVAKRDAKQGQFDDIVRNGKNLVAKKDVTDTVPVRDKIKALEGQWKDLNSLLEDKQKLSRARADQLGAYEKLRDQVLEWLTTMETRVVRLEPVAIEIETLKRQTEQLKPLMKEYKDYGNTIDKVNDLGNVYDGLLRGERPDSPARRRSSGYSPTKRTSVTSSPLRRTSHEARSPSPTKSSSGGFSVQSPVSPGGSSGFSSRRSSQDGFHLEELSPVQQQLTEINNRYGLLGVRLSDRQAELDSIREEVKKHLDNLRSLGQFLDKVQRNLPKETVPHTKEDADKIAKQMKTIVEDMYEKQSLLDSTRSQVNDLLRRKPGALGADSLQDELKDVVSRWKTLHDQCKNRIKFMEDMKDFHDTYDNLSGWLSAKDRMMTVLGPISSDSRMVQSQVQQVQVLREEFRTQQPQLSHLSEVGESVLARLDPGTPDAQRLSARLTSILQRWADLLGRLDERADSLGAAVDTSREFDAGLNRLRDALQGISDQLDDLPLDKDPEEQLRKIENLERQLEGQRPLLADAEAAGAQLCEVLSDPASRAEIQAKLGAVGRQYNTLQKKLDHRKAEVEGSLRDGRQFEASCAKTLGWLSDELGGMSEKLLVSADRDVLQQQVDHHEPIYKDVMSKEHEVIMLLNKGHDMLSRSAHRNSGSGGSDTRNLQRDLDKIQQQWDRLRKDTVERHTRLQTCMEHCRKYYRAQESFLPWLTQAENKLETLQPASFKRKDIERQLKELGTFRNEVWKRSGEYENHRMLGDTFVAACDIDKEVVKSELAVVKQRWDKLNNDLLERTQSLEDTARRLTDFTENLRDLQHSLQRCEDKLASHDALGGASKDPKLLERVKALREEAGGLKKPLQSVRQVAGDLVNEAGEHGVDASHLQDEVDNLADRLDDLQAKLDDRCSELQSAATAVTQFNDQVKGLTHDLSDLEHELDAMKPPGRDLKTVRGQLDDTGKLLKKIAKAANDVAKTVSAGEHLVDNGFAPDTAATREQVELLRRQLGRLDERAKSREEDLNSALNRLELFYQIHTAVIRDIAEVSERVRKLKPVGSEVEGIKAQQEEFRALQTSSIEPLTHQVEDCNRLGQGLIQSAAGGVNTSSLEKDLEKMNDKWNDLKDRLNERDRKLDVGLLQSGKFQEALDGLSKWLADTEEMVANQKPPSADYKVVKAQLQEQKFLKKMLLDRQNSMTSLFAMGNEVAAGADPVERKGIERQLRELMERFENLTTGATQRYEDLQQAMAVAKDFQDKLVPLLEWLDRTEKQVKDMELVPTDEEKIQQRIKEHSALHNDILRKKPDFLELTEVASALMALVGEDEASGLAFKVQDMTDRYAALVGASENVGQLLQQSRAGLRHLVLTYQDLQAWMEGMENRLAKYRVLAVHTDKLLEQMDDLADLTEEIANHQSQVDGTVDSGLELMKHISNDEALQLKDKLDLLQRRFNDLTTRGADLLKHAQEALPLVQQFHNSHNRLVDWMMGAEAQLQCADPREEDIQRLEQDIQEFRPVLESINLVGPQLCQISPGEGASTIEGLVTRDNRRFDAIAEQIQRKGERIQLSKQRSLEVIGDIDELLDWFREVESQIRDAEPPSSDPDVIRVQLKEHKALNDDISSQKGRVRDVLSTAKKVLRESAQHEDTSTIREKMEDLRETMDTVSALSSDRLGVLEQALPLAEHFHETHAGLVSWLDEMEQQVAMLAMPALRPDLITQQQDRNEMFVQSISEHKPLVEKLNKTGEALIKLCNDEEGVKVQDILDADNARYAALRSELRQRQQALEHALQESSKFSDKLEGMLRALGSTADQINSAEPVSAHPPRIRDQMDENAALVEDLDKREEAFAAVKRAADDVISKAGNRADAAVKDIKRKLDRLNSLWNEVQKATNDRGKSLEDALVVAERFWDELHNIMATLRDLQDSLSSQEPPAVEPAAIQQQQVVLQEIRHEIDQTKPEVDQCRQTGQELMSLCGEPDKPEVKKHIEDLDSAWDNVTALYAKREENLIDAMEKAMEFHETLQNLLEFLESAEDRFAGMGPLGSDIDAVKRQIEQLKDFKADVDPHMVKVEALNRQAQELTERTSADQAAAIKEPLSAVNRRWDELLRGMVERQRQLENALLRLGQFQHALAELLVWIEKTDATLDELKPVAGDPQVLEVELAKLKVLVNDIQAHQTSVDTLNDAGRQIIESGKGTAEASATQEKLSQLNRHWRDLLAKAADRQHELEDALREAQRFHAEIQDLLSWLGDVDGVIAASKPVGGLPETASEQLERFMEVYNELEQSRPKVETVLQQGQEYLKKSGSGAANNLQHNLRTLKHRWDSVTARASDKKIKLEIALKEATEFHEALQAFVDWLTNAEKILSSLKPVSRVMETILGQIEEHKAFQKDVGVHRETMLNLDKKGTHLKYFSQKQDVILIKNLLISVQHRWERVVSKSAERTRALDHGYKEAREFHDSWSGLMSWLGETEKSLDDLAVEASGVGNDPEKIKARLAKHREFQRALSGKQATYDATMRAGKTLKERAPKSDEPALKQMMTELKNKWNAVCAKSVDRQRKLEEALLFSGQFKDAVQALLEWLQKVEKVLSEQGPVHGDLDTVMALVEQHKTFEEDLANRAAQMESVRRTGQELEAKATPSDAATIRSQLSELKGLWDKVSSLSRKKSVRLEDALKEAERLHKAVHMLLEWLSDAEMKLRFAGPLPEDEQETRNQLTEHDKFMREMAEKEREKDNTIALAKQILAKAHPDGATVIKHWITIIQSRWEEVSTWAKQREQRLQEHLRSLRDLEGLLEELLAWLAGLESTLLTLEAEPLPDDIPTLESLISDHREFMENTSKRQPEVDSVCKSRQQVKPQSTAQQTKDRKFSRPKTPSKERSRDNRDSSPEYDSPSRKSSLKRGSSEASLGPQSRRESRASPGREKAPELIPHIGPRFAAKGSKDAEPVFRNPRVKLLWDKWRSVWMLAWERQRRLQEKYSYLLELEKVKNFSWDDWRKRFLKFMNHKKSRLTDLFRKMDKNNDGLIPREDFIDGIMKTKFDTSRLEMNAVADLFDRSGEGLIDWKEFIAALRPDWEERKPANEAEKIHDEVKRLVMLCTCRQKFRVFQVGEGKYRFGDSQKLRLVRILRSTVMVRVGGGWVALDEFLVKNDPCRAKGRTNIELREQFILAEGVSQSMTAFKPKASPGASSAGPQRTQSVAGPITKVRERSARSVPMGRNTGRSSFTGGTRTPDSLSDNESTLPRSVRKGSAPPRSSLTPGGSQPGSKAGSRPSSRPSSRPQSRQGSKPPSRHGSTLSLDSTDEGTPSRIPVHRRATPSSRTAGSGSGTTTPTRKLTVPVNGTSPSSRPRTPTGLISPASGASSRNRTPSGSSTPIPSGAKVTRKTSGASDTATGTSRKSSKAATPTESRAPFRL